MLHKRLVGLLVAAHLLGLATTEDAAVVLVSIVTVDGEVVLAEAYVLDVDGIEVALAEREVVDGVKEVGLAGTVVADKAIDIAAEADVNLRVVLEVI